MQKLILQRFHPIFLDYVLLNEFCSSCLGPGRARPQTFLGRRDGIDWGEHNYSAKQHGGPRGQSDLGRWRGNLTASIPY